MTTEEIRTIAAGIAELTDRMTRLERTFAEVRKLARERNERLSTLERNFKDVDEIVGRNLFGPPDSEPVFGDTLHERVEVLEAAINRRTS